MTKGKILKLIRSFCLNCMGNISSEVINCSAPKCQLYDFRLGKDPYPSKRGPKSPYFSATERVKRSKIKTLDKE